MKRKLLCALLAALMLLAAGCSGGAKIVPIDTLSPAQTQANVYTPAPTQTAQVQADEPLVVARIEESGMSIGTRINPPPLTHSRLLPLLLSFLPCRHLSNVNAKFLPMVKEMSA